VYEVFSIALAIAFGCIEGIFRDAPILCSPADEWFFLYMVVSGTCTAAASVGEHRRATERIGPQNLRATLAGIATTRYAFGV